MRYESFPVVAALALFATPLVAQDRSKPWYQMDYGPCLSTTVQGFTEDNVALKGRFIRLGDRAGVLFDTELLRVATAFVDGYVSLRGTPFDGGHGPIPHAIGREVSSTKQAPGWAKDGNFDDPRPIPHGPLPRDHARFEGHWFHGEQVVLQYRVGERKVLETFELLTDAGGKGIGIARCFEFGPGPAIRAVLTDVPKESGPVGRSATGLAGGYEFDWQRVEPPRGDRPEVIRRARTTIRYAGNVPLTLITTGGRVEMEVVASDHALFSRVAFWTRDPDAAALDMVVDGTVRDISGLTRGGPRRCEETITTPITRGASEGPFAVDSFGIPAQNPWHSRLRFGAFDFVDPDTAALSTWNGDVWLLHGVSKSEGDLVWSRFCTGLHDPLGLKVVDGVIYTHGRDGLHRLRDVNKDGECDFVEVFNNDILITKGFHEFAFDLQTDAAGNFYFSKGGPVNPGGRGFQKLVPHHGIIGRVSKDGSKLDVVATGLRAPNGIGVRADGVVTSGDNQGTWMPACRLNLSTNGTFWGCTDTAWREQKPTTYDEPICWLPMSVDNSGGGQVWVPDGTWGVLSGRLIHQSYGQSTNYLVLTQEHDGKTQGAVVRLPMSFESSQMRGRFSRGDLYTVGFQGWQTNAAKETAFHRVRRTDKPLRMPLQCRFVNEGVELEFSDALDREVATDPSSWEVEIWNYLWSENYGSPEYAPSAPDRKVKEGEKNRDRLAVRAVELSEDGKRVFLAVDGMQTVMQIRVGWSVDAAMVAAGQDAAIDGELHGTIHFLVPRSGER
jgi:hypothetical protein